MTPELEVALVEMEARLRDVMEVQIGKVLRRQDHTTIEVMNLKDKQPNQLDRRITDIESRLQAISVDLKTIKKELSFIVFMIIILGIVVSYKLGL